MDSTAVIALGTNQVVGTLATGWRTDLPFVAPDGGIAIALGNDVVVTDGATLRATTRVEGGASDFWYPFRWTGFRPRAEELDQPVEFAGPPVDSTTVPADSATALDSAAAPVARAPTPPPPPRDTAVRRPPAGFTVNNPNAQRTCGCGQSFS